MNDSRSRGPTRPPNRSPFFRDPRPNLEPEPGFEEEAPSRPPHGPREPGGPPGRRPPREPVEPGMPPSGRRFPRDMDDPDGGFERRPSRASDDFDPDFKRRPSRGPDDFDPGFERRPPRRSRPPDMNAEMPLQRRPRAASLERPDWEYGEPEMRDGRPNSRVRTDRGPGSRPGRRSRPPDWASAPGSSARPRRRKIRKRYHYAALLGIMLFALVAGIGLGVSGLGSTRGANMLLIAASIPAMLLGMGFAFVYAYY